MVGKSAALLKFKEWLTLQQATDALSAQISEPVTVADVLQLGLDGHLTLSVRFVNHARARPGREVPRSGATYSRIDVPGTGLVDVPNGLWLTDDTILELGDVRKIEGVYDLAMLGAERLDIDHQLQALTGGPAVTLTVLEGVFVRALDGGLYQLQRRFEDDLSPDDGSGMTPVASHLKAQYYPAGRLPDDAVVVVRPSALSDFASRALHQDKPVSDSERHTWAILVAAAMSMPPADWNTRGISKALEGATTKLEHRVAERTIRDYLARIREAFEEREA